MESTEDCPSDGIIGSEHLTSSGQFSIAKYEDCASDVSENVESVEDTGQQVYGYLSVSEDTENATIIIQPQVIECGSQRLIIAQAEEGNEIYVVVSGDQDQQLVQASSQNSVIHPDVILESISKHQISHVEECTQDFQYIQAEEKVVEEDASDQNSNVINNEVSNETAVWTFKGSVPNQEGNTEMVFIPAQSILSSSQVLTPEESKHRKLMQLACIAHEMRSVDPSVVADSTENTELSTSTTEESVIAIQQPLELEQHSPSLPSKPDEDSASNSYVNENSGNELSEAVDNQSVELKMSNLSECPQSKSRIIDNAVSVIHSPPTYNAVVENLSTSCTQSDSLNDRDDCNQTEDMSSFSDSNEQIFNLNSECKLSIDEDSNTMSSQTSGLDLTIDSKIHYSSETEEAHSVKEESKPGFCSQTIIKRNLECENNISSESDGHNTNLSLSRNISPILIINNECNEKSVVNNKTSIENDSLVEDASVGMVCENPPDEPSIDAFSNDIQEDSEVLRADSPKLNSVVSNESCNAQSSSSVPKDHLNKNDLIFEKNKVSSLSQECQLPKKKFRIRPDLEKEIAEMCNSRNGSLSEMKGYVDSGDFLTIKNTEISQNLPKVSSNKVEDNEEPKECSKHSLVRKSEALNIQNTEVSQNLLKVSNKVEDNEETKKCSKHFLIAQSEILNIQSTEVSQNVSKDSSNKVNDTEELKVCSEHSLVCKSDVLNIQNTEVNENLPKDPSIKVNDNEGLKYSSNKVNDNEEPKDSSNKVNDNEELKDSSNKVNDNEELKDSSNKVNDNEELKDSSNKVNDNEEPKDSSNKVNDNEEPKDSSNKVNDKEELKDSSNKVNDNEEPKYFSNKVKDNEEPKDSLNKVNDNEEPKDPSNKVNEEPKECSIGSLVDKSEVPNIQDTELSKNLPKDTSNKVNGNKEPKKCSKLSIVSESEVFNIQNIEAHKNLLKDSSNKVNDNKEPKECSKHSIVDKSEIPNIQNIEVGQNLPKESLNKINDNEEPKECTKRSLIGKLEVLNIQNTEASQNLSNDSLNKVKDNEERKECLKNSLVGKSESVVPFQSTSKSSNNEKENPVSEADNSMHTCEENHETVEQFKKLDKDVSSAQNEIECEKTQSNTFAAENSGATNINNNSLERKKGSDVFNVLLEENLVKPPKVTYASRKRKMNLSQNDITAPKERRCMFSPDDEIGKKDNCSDNGMTLKHGVLSHGNNDVDSDFAPSKIKVSLNYTRKRRNVSPVLEETKTRNLRKRTRSSTGSDLLDTDSKNDTNASSNEVTNWGNILLSTSFQSVKSDCHSVSQSSPELSETSKETHAKPVNKISSKSEAQWQKFMKSTSPKKVKSQDKKLREKVKRQVRSLCKSERFTSQFVDSRDPFSKIGKKKSQSLNGQKHCDKKNSITIPIKTSGIRYLNDKQPSTSSSTPNFGNSSSEKDFNCSNCSFSTNKVNNIVAHMKHCSNKESIRLLDYSVDDMDRRQRIRGEDVMESWYEKELNTSFLSNGSVESDINEPSCSSIARELSADDSDDDEFNDRLVSKSKYGFKEKSVVWVQRKKGYWPALIWRLNKGKACVYLISTPETNEMLKVDFKKLHSFDDAKWNNQLLKQANKYHDKDNFVKAVQKCQSYLNKKLLGQRRIDVRSFFKIADNAKFGDSEEEECSVENVIKEHISLETDATSGDSLKSQCIADCILQGEFDDDLVSIYKKQTNNERHANFFKKSPKDQLVFTASFGPFKKNADMDRVFTHLDELFRDHIGEEPHKISYIYEVWIPEAITKAISVIKHVTLDEAKTIFYNIRPE